MEESEDQCTHVDVFITEDKIIYVHRDSQDELCDCEIATNDTSEKICSVVSDKRSEKVKECFSREPKEADDKDHHDLIVVETDDAITNEINHIVQELCPDGDSRASTPAIRAPRYKRGSTGMVPADKPQNYMWLALCTTIFVNPPFGIIGLIIASKFI